MAQNALQIKLANSFLDEIIHGTVDEKHRDTVEREILQKALPNNWNVHVEDNMEKKLEVDFRLYAISVSDHLNVSIDEMTVFDFYSSIRYLKEKFKKQK